jgi:hypothetical protein
MIAPFTINLDGELCEEIIGQSKRCDRPAYGLIWHDREREAYKMCLSCAEHSVDNRGAILLAVKNLQK